MVSQRSLLPIIPSLDHLLCFLVVDALPLPSRPFALTADQQLTALLNLLSTPLITNLLLALQQAAFSASPSSSGPQKELEIILKTLANVVKLIGEFCDRGKWGTGVDGPVRGARGRETWSREMDARETVGRKIGELLEVRNFPMTST